MAVQDPAQGRPQRPYGLDETGRSLWDAIALNYALRPDELHMLEQACREADIIAHLQESLIDAPVRTRGSQGQEVADPILTEIRQHRATQATLLKALKLPDAPGAFGGAGRDRAKVSESARKAARARWGSGSGATG